MLFMGDLVARLNLVANLGWRFLRAQAPFDSPALPIGTMAVIPWMSYSCFEMSVRGSLRSLVPALVQCSVIRCISMFQSC